MKRKEYMIYMNQNFMKEKPIFPLVLSMSLPMVQQKVIENNIKMVECLSEEAIIEFEESCNIQLPEAYRIFLKNIGNGCDDCCLNRLEDIERKDL